MDERGIMKKRTLTEQFLYEMRKELISRTAPLSSLMAKTRVIRIIKHFPKGGNQANRKAVFYGEYGELLATKEATYLSPIYLRQALPKRITVIEDNEYMSGKDFDFYEV
jgi:hypothetical protein